ncbi:MAG: anthranilate synthase component I family protein [Propionibacteriaceae bacterium]|nr:anthranilate synthase component I family protein [Propionibacteriaceae bacterium]
MVSSQLVIDLATLQSWSGSYRSAPIALKLTGVKRTPIEVFLACKTVSHHCFILESMEDADSTGRYTFIGYDPSLEFFCKDGHVTIREPGRVTHHETTTPGAWLSTLLTDIAGPRVDFLPPFTGGFAGYIGYDYIKYAEPSLRLDSYDEEGFRDIDLMYFDKVIAFDHLTDEVYLIHTITLPSADSMGRHPATCAQDDEGDARNDEEALTQDDTETGARLSDSGPESLSELNSRAAEVLEQMAQVVTCGEMAEMPRLRTTSEFEALFSKEEFVDIIAKAKEHIVEGDIFQVVPSNRLRAPAEGSLFETYQLMRRTNPSPYMFYFSSDDLELAGCSPETLVKLTGDEVMTFPLAGTRPRGTTPAEDIQLEADLLADAKELAEHTMLVDLGRNDIGKVSRFGSVEVTEYMEILRFSHVMHIGSVVSGRVREGVTAMDAIQAVLPAGTLSGAPKIMACQIINDLEGVKRGIYGGAIGYISTTGDMDTCIAIRLAYKKGDNIYVRAGCGIVADSNPEAEWEETINKMKAVITALGDAQNPGRDSRSCDCAQDDGESFTSPISSPCGTQSHSAQDPDSTSEVTS